MGNYDSQIDPADYKKEFDAMKEEEQNSVIMNPSGVDEGKWKKAKEISQETYGEHKWPFIMWLTEHKL